MDKKLAANSTLAHYRIVSQIGVGGMGEVYLAEDTKLERKVALKVLPSEVAANEDRMRRFTQEAKAAAALNHPNIAHIYEIGEADGTNFIAMEFVDGKMLGEFLRDPVNLPRTLRILQHVADALSKAHAAGIVHRDLKPDNIMITRDWHAKILDFGLAKLVAPAGLGESQDSSNVATAILEHHSAPGTILGTAGYMSPEQAQGRVNEIDHRSDIFSFGCILFEAATGQRAFEGADAIDTLNKIIREPAPLVSSINPSAHADLQRVIRRCLAKDPEERYQSIKDVAIELKELRHEMTGELDTTIPPMSTGGTTASWQRSTDGHIEVPSAVVSDASTRVSSAEYLVSEIKRRKPAAAILSVILVGAIGFSIWFFGFRSTPAAQINSIAVLPFQNTGGNADSEYLSDGLAESLIYRLSQLPDLKVSPASSVMRYKGKEFDPQRIAAELGVQAVMSGRMNQRGDNLSISVELIDAANNKVIWGEQYEKKMSDLLATQREIATAIVDKLQLKLSGSESTGITKKYTNSSEAYQLYLKGRFQWNKRTVEGLKAAEGFYKQAIESDPSFALAYSALAETYVLFPNYSVESPRESSPKAKAAATKAIELDPTLAEPHAALGLYHSLYTWDLEASERELRRAIELNPKYATAYHWLGTILPILGKCDEAITVARRAEELDPLSAIISADVAYDLMQCRRYDEALAQVEKTLRLDPNFYYIHYVAGWAHSMKGDHAQALASFRRSRELNTDPFATMLFIQALVRAGERAEAMKLRDELRSTSNREAIDPYIFALAEAALGNKDAAFASLEKTLTERGVYAPFLASDPNVEDLRSDPRFEVLMKRIRSSRLE